MKGIKKVVGAILLGTALVTSTVPVLADSSNTEIVPYAQLGMCSACGYGSATVVSTSYGPWLDRIYQKHGNHDDIWQARSMYVTTQCPNCGKRITDSASQMGYYCPDRGYTVLVM